MLDRLRFFINEDFDTAEISPQQLDLLLADGWRHFGEHFFRYNIGFYESELRVVLPLRVRLENFTKSKSQRRVLSRNRDLRIIIRPIEITEEKEILFDRHKRRFDHNIPDSIYDFLSHSPSNVPCEALEICVYDAEENLLAASFFDVGEAAISAVYAMFEPTETRRSLGIFTMLSVIDYAIKNGKTFYYPGYAYEGNSFYDYKKRFSGLEVFDWENSWKKFNNK